MEFLYHYEENPTQPLFASVELGDVQSTACNPYNYASDFNESYTELDYENIQWLDPSDPRPYFDINSNEIYNPSSDFLLGLRTSTFTDDGSKNIYSRTTYIIRQ